MIKIEFKEAQKSEEMLGFPIWEIVEDDCRLRLIFDDCSVIRSITKYIPIQDPMLDRSHILSLLGITKKQDEANQIEWQCK